MSGPARLCAALFLGLIATQCGYTTGLSVAPDFGSVGVEIFSNDSLLPNLERELHAEVTRSLRNLTDLPIQAPRDADLVISGRIVSYGRRAGIRSPQNELLESAVRIGVITELRDRPGRDTVAGPVTVRTQVGYTLEAAGNEREARRRALRVLADQIVLDLFAEASENAADRDTSGT